MAASMFNHGCRQVMQKAAKSECMLSYQQMRHRYTTQYRGKTPDMARTWRSRVDEIKKQAEGLNSDVNIGLSKDKLRLIAPVGKRERPTAVTEAEQAEELERAARHRQLKIPIDEVQEDTFKERGPKVLQRIARHYGIYHDLFDGAYFLPHVNLRVCYDTEDGDDLVSPVHCGNRLLPSEVSAVPAVSYESGADTLWTLCMTAPDSHLQDNGAEYLHWMVGNIPGSAIEEGEVLCDYLPPFPARHTGFHRYVFILYAQDKKLDYSASKIPNNSVSLAERTFNTLEFYRKHQEEVTPAGLAFFQSEWDNSVTDTFRNTLGMREPSFEFMFPPPYHPRQLKYPHKQPFNLYLDRYRDKRDIQEEVLLEKLKTVSPFKPRPARPAYPNVFPVDQSLPSWRKLRVVHQRLRRMHWKGLDD